MERYLSGVEFWDAFGGGVYLFFLPHPPRPSPAEAEPQAHLFLALASAGALAVSGTGSVLRRLGPHSSSFLLPDSELAGALRVAENLRRRVADLAMEARRGRLTVSLGAARYRPGRDIEEAISRADRPLYRAKEGGRNRSEADESFPAEPKGLSSLGS